MLTFMLVFTIHMYFHVEWDIVIVSTVSMAILVLKQAFSRQAAFDINLLLVVAAATGPFHQRQL